MNHRERVLATLNHQVPDRVPVDLAGTLSTSINIGAYKELKAWLGIETPTELLSLRSMIPNVEEEVLQRYDIDTRSLPLLGNSRPGERTEDGGYKDEWGVVRKQAHSDAHFMDVENPLDGTPTLEDLENYPWPDPEDPGYTEGLAEEAERLRQTDYALLLTLPVGPLHLAQWLRGYANWLMDLVDNQEFFEAMMDRIMTIWLRIAERMLQAAGAHSDILFYGDDIAYQHGPMVRYDTYVKHIKPYQQRILDLLKGYPGKVLYHSCGSVVSLIDDLIELGVDALNPVQVSAAGMDTADLKRRYGDRLVFWGGIDTQHVLPHGSPEDVRQEVRRRIHDLAPGGGYVLCAVHNIQREVPPENVHAMYDEALASGKY